MERRCTRAGALGVPLEQVNGMIGARAWDEGRENMYDRTKEQAERGYKRRNKRKWK